MHNAARIIPLVSFLLLLVAACASTPEASLTSDADAKRFEPAINAAIVYVYRPVGAGHGVSTLWVNDRLLGETLPLTYFRVPVRPGRTRIAAAGGDSGRIEFETQRDGIYFVEAQVAGESQSESSTIFRRVLPETGKSAIVNCCRMLETWRPGQQRFNF
jgi:hypothetical protein